jgi:hypothetical protein
MQPQCAMEAIKFSIIFCKQSAPTIDNERFPRSILTTQNGVSSRAGQDAMLG